MYSNIIYWALNTQKQADLVKEVKHKSDLKLINGAASKNVNSHWLLPMGPFRVVRFKLRTKLSYPLKFCTRFHQLSTPDIASQVPFCDNTIKKPAIMRGFFSNGAASKNRTCDPVITNDVLYHWAMAALTESEHTHS